MGAIASGVGSTVGLPTKSSIQEAFGFVTDEDRERWEKMDQRVKAQEEKGSGEVAKGSMMLPQQAMQARMRAAENTEAQSRTRMVIQTDPTTRPSYNGDREDDREMGY